ncbi:MAG: hypothetical protein AAGA81_20070 [Acidobacteriota bacterium]
MLRTAALISLAVLTLPTSASPLSSTTTTADIPENVTYAGEVAQVLHENCVSCHRTGDIAPMSLTSYDEARPWAKSILRAVQNGDMPPWHATPEHGKFKNDRRLSERELAILDRWVQQGAPAGDLAAAPEAPEFSSDWRLGEPDLVVTFDSVDLPAGGPDVFRDLIQKTGLDEDRWIRAVEVLPQDRRVVHHVIIYAASGDGPPSSGWLGAWAAGMDPMVFPPGTAKLLGKGDRLIADMHYHPADEPATDATQIGLHFYDGEPEKELINLWVQNSSFAIPAGVDNHKVTASHTFTEDSVVHALLPHMHYRGKDFTYVATYPDGRKETLLEVQGYDFNWQTNYELAEPLTLPKGSRIDCVAHFDNSTGNPDNPDPTKTVRFGNESFDEMMIGFVDYTLAEGRSPQTAEAQIAALREEVAASGTKAWDVQLHNDGNSALTLLTLPDEGDAQWWVPVNGMLIAGKLANIERDGEKITGQLVTPVGSLDMSATLAASGTIRGKMFLGDDLFTFEGEPIEP